MANEGCAKYLKNDLTTLILRLLIVYALLLLCKIAFYLYNVDSLGTITIAELPGLIKGSLVFDTISVLYSNSLFIFLSLVPFRFRQSKVWQSILKWVFFVVNTLLIIVLNLADSIYFHYAKKRITTDELHFMNNDNTADLVGRFMLENWYMVLTAIVLTAGMVWCYKKIKDHAFTIKNPLVYYPVSLLALGLAVVLAVGGIRGGFTRAVRPLALGNAAQYAPDHLKAAMILSQPFCVIRTMGSAGILVPQYFSEEELAAIFTPYHNPKKEMESIGRRNVVIFTMESFSAEHSAFLNPDLYTNDETNTPFLDSLMEQGYVFMNAYSNGRKSIDALPSILASIPSYKKPFALMPQSLGEINGLPKLLGSEGYNTSFFCGSQRNSMGFAAFASLVGIENIYMREEYERARGTNDFDGAWGIWDEPFLGYMGETLTGIPEPFFATVFTLSSHHPFEVPAEYKDLLGEGRTKIHRSVRYTDMAVRKFFEYARMQEWFENTIFVFVADHVSSEIFAERSKNPTGNSAIIMFIYTPDGVIKERDYSVAQQMDIMPTVLGLVGYDKPYFAFGRDVINEPERKAAATNYTNEMYQYISDSIVLFSDGDRFISAYEKRDSLQQNDIKERNTPEQQEGEKYLKAILQQYYRHLSEMDYTVKPQSSEDGL